MRNTDVPVLLLHSITVLRVGHNTVELDFRTAGSCGHSNLDIVLGHFDFCQWVGPGIIHLHDIHKYNHVYHGHRNIIFDHIGSGWYGIHWIDAGNNIRSRSHLLFRSVNLDWSDLPGVSGRHTKTCENLAFQKENRNN